MAPPQPRAGMSRHFGIRIIAAGKDKVVGEIDADERHLNAGGIVHGGAYMAFGDELGGYAAGTYINGGGIGNVRGAVIGGLVLGVSENLGVSCIASGWRDVIAFLILVLSVQAAETLGSWVLAIGLMRYAYAAVAAVAPWLRCATPPSMARKTVAAVQGVVLTAVAPDLLPRTVAAVLVALALTALVWSFGSQIW